MDEDPDAVALDFAKRHGIDDDQEAVQDTADAIRAYMEVYREKKRKKKAAKGT
jgi:hypothetical protein